MKILYDGNLEKRMLNQSIEKHPEKPRISTLRKVTNAGLALLTMGIMGFFGIREYKRFYEYDRRPSEAIIVEEGDTLINIAKKQFEEAGIINYSNSQLNRYIGAIRRMNEDIGYDFGASKTQIYEEKELLVPNLN